MNLSSSSLGLFSDCAMCFYLEKKLKISRPRGIFSSLPNGVDRVMKEWANDLAEIPFLETDKGKHTLFADRALLKKWQNWRSGLKWADGKGNFLIGALDEVLMNSRNAYVPTDWKTRGSAANQEGVEKYYSRQVDCYALLLSTVGAVADYGFILSGFPTEFDEGRAAFEFQTFCLSADPARAKELFARALSCLESDITPPAGTECDYCNFVVARDGK